MVRRIMITNHREGNCDAARAREWAGGWAASSSDRYWAMIRKFRGATGLTGAPFVGATPPVQGWG